jgi:hypothetical protein
MQDQDILSAQGVGRLPLGDVRAQPGGQKDEE